ncbi:MAG: hypothetical protein RIC15_09695 [Vicingaceae bacterium]
MTVATAKIVQISDLNFELTLWLNELKFYKDEVAIFNSRLEEIVGRSTEQEFTSQLEHFQNQYIREIEVIDELRHDIKQYENGIEKVSPDRPVTPEDNYMDGHKDLRDQMNQFRKIYYELREEFINYLNQWI